MAEVEQSTKQLKEARERLDKARASSSEGGDGVVLLEQSVQVFE